MGACNVSSTGDYQDKRHNLEAKSHSSLKCGDIVHGDACMGAAKGAEGEGQHHS